MLARAGRLDLLQLVGERIAVPEAVAAEVAEHSDEGAWSLGAHEWLERVPAIDIPTAVASWDLGRGESAVLAWAVAHPGALAVIDDYAARTCAEGASTVESDRRVGIEKLLSSASLFP